MFSIIFAPEYRKGSQFISEIEAIVNKAGLETTVIFVSTNIDPSQQMHFACAAQSANIVIADCTIPTGANDGGIYPALTAQVNCFNHVIVVSETELPLNITPYRGIYPSLTATLTQQDILRALPQLIEQSLKEDTYGRLPVEIYEDAAQYLIENEKMIRASLDSRKKAGTPRKLVMLSYRNNHRDEVEAFRTLVEGATDECHEKRLQMGIEERCIVKILPPASLCGAYEAHTPMRRWMLVSLLDDHIREVDELWVYESRDENGNIDYTHSWWTIAELVMVAYVNHSKEKQIKVRAFNAKSRRFYDTTPEQYLVHLTDKQCKRIARILSNSRPDTMGPEVICRVRKLKLIAKILRFTPRFIKNPMLNGLRQVYKQTLPQTTDAETRQQIIDEMIGMYADPQKLEKYANDEVFSHDFWERISYQTAPSTACFRDNRIDVETFISTPMDEMIELTLKDLTSAACSKEQRINLGSPSAPKWYKVEKAPYDKYLWLASRMGHPALKTNYAPGLNKIDIFNIDQWEE